MRREFYKKFYNGKKSKSFFYIKELSNFKGIPKNLVFDTDLNILRLQPTLEIIKKSENFWKRHNYKICKFYNTVSVYQKNRYKNIINEIVKIKKIKKILDYGCGDLVFLKMLMKSIKVESLDGYDLNVQKSFSKKMKGGGVEIKIWDKNDINKRAGYDLISLNWVLTNTFSPWKILDTCKSLLKDDAHLIVTDSNVIMNKNIIKKVDTYFKVEDIKINQFVRPFHFTTLDLKNILMLSGFQVIKTLCSDELNFKILIAKKVIEKKPYSCKIKINNKKKYAQFLKSFLV